MVFNRSGTHLSSEKANFSTQTIKLYCLAPEVYVFDGSGFSSVVFYGSGL